MASIAFSFPREQSVQSTLILGLLRSISFIAALALAIASPLGAAENIGSEAEMAAKPKIGDKIGLMEFKDIRYLPRSLNDLSHKDDKIPKRAFVLVFTNTTCPLVQKYMPRLIELDRNYRDKGVQVVAVNVGLDDTIMDMATQMVLHGAEFPFVKDMDGNCVRACGVGRTPEAVVIDADHRLRYRGRIDNQYRLGGTARTADANELRDAIEALLAGQEIEVPETIVDGCKITLPTPPKPSGKFTYHGEIAQIVAKHCQECHQPGTSAPFELMTYDDVKSQAEMIAEVVAERRMPPWYAAKEFGEFTNCRVMSGADREALLDWIRSGMPQGNVAAEEKIGKPKRPVAGAKVGSTLPVVESSPSDSEKIKEGEEGDSFAGRQWLMGQPDIVITAPAKYTVPADGYVDYKYVIIPYLFLQDTWIIGAEILPDNPRVVHHCNLGYVSLAQGRGGMPNATLITGYVPGGGPMELRDNVAARIPAGSLVGLQVHLTTTGKEETCRLRVGFKFPREVVQKELHHLPIHTKRFAIAPYAPAHTVAASRSVKNDVTLFGYFAHMHVRGRDVTFKAHPPKGEAKTLLMLPNYSFDWQQPFYCPTDKEKFPGGTRFEVVAHFDNSTFNPYNPDPSATVRFGQQTYEEMMYGYVFYTENDERLNMTVDPKTGHAMTTK
jgi:thiol-disulfide isomerase/thioredoxin